MKAYKTNWLHKSMSRNVAQTNVWRKQFLCASTALVISISANQAAYSQSATIGGLNPALLGTQGTAGATGSSINGTAVTGQNQNTVTNQGQADNSRVSGFGLNQDRQANQAAAQQSQLQGQQQAAQTGANVPVPAIATTAAGQGVVAPVAPQGADQAIVGSVVSQQGGGITADQTPFDPLGVRAGRFILRPSLQTSIGYTSNSIQDIGGEGSAFVSSQAALGIETDLARHAAGLQIDANVARFASGEDEVDADLNINGIVRYDIDNDTSVTGLLSLNIGEDDLNGIADDPLEGTLIGTLQLDHRLRQFDTRTQLRGSRNVNGSFVDGAGTTISQDDQNSFLVGLNFRGTRRRGGTFSPFIEGDVSSEFFDDAAVGVSSAPTVTGLRGIIGTEIERGDKLNGEVSIGFGENLVDSDNVDNFGGIIAEANLIWSPQRLNTITFNAGTAFDAFPSLATPGDTTYTFNVLGARQVKENLEVSAGGGVLVQVDGGVGGTDVTYSANAGIAYSLNRNVALTADYTFAREFSADGLGDFTSNSIALGLRLER
ncbi:MAG: outer membrane beta-barrel protein [Hyphomicrobiales bacterium]